MLKNLHQIQWYIVCSAILFLSFLPIRPLFAQSSSHPEKNLFSEDSSKAKKLREKKQRDIKKTVDKAPEKEVNFVAPSVRYDKEKQTVEGSGGILISHQGMQVQAAEGKVRMDTKDADVHGNVVITQQEGTFLADDARFNLDTETGEFRNARFSLEQGGYGIESRDVTKLSEFEYRLKDSKFSTCNCDGVKPWSIESDSADITQEGYAYTYGTTLKLQGIPFFYSPFFGFPAKMERASGLLAPELGYSNRDGMKYRQPIFVAWDDSTDSTITPFIQTRTRTGVGVGLRETFSLQNKMSTRWIYSDERARGDNLRGIVSSDGLVDPHFDKDRFAGFMSHEWSANQGSSFPIDYVTDIHYVGDNLFIREFEDNEIGNRTARYTTSTMALRAGLGDYFSTSLSGEYNQALYGVSKQDESTITQRLPEWRVDGIKSFRPFGYNSYGLKLVTKGNSTVTQFQRDDESIDGTRTNLTPEFAIPFHVRNYVNGQVQVAGYKTLYNLNNSTTTGGIKPEDFDRSRTRETMAAQYSMSTSLEKVYDIDKDGLLSTLTNLGAANQSQQLSRVKNTISPVLKYTWIPTVSGQDELPFFDSVDRIRDRSLFSYGIDSAWMGRFEDSRASSQIEEITPGSEDLPVLDYSSPFIGGAFFNQDVSGGRVVSRKGEVRNLVGFSMRQTYDYFEDRKKVDLAREAFSDIDSAITFNPTKTFSFGVDGSVRPSDQSLSQWGTRFITRDDRGDELRLRYSFVDPIQYENGVKVTPNNLSQLEAGTELVMTDQLKLGFYGRYDLTDSNFLEDGIALRFISSCNCWHADIGYSSYTNPDKDSVSVKFTFMGLGDLAQDLLKRNGTSSATN